MSGAIHVYETCNIGGCEDTYGKYGIKPLKPGGNYFIWWIDEGDPDITRRTLRTGDFQTARRKMIAWAEGLQPDYLGGNPLFIRVLTDYLQTLPRVHQHRRVASMLSDTLAKHASDTKFSQLYEGRQKLWMEDLRDAGYAPKTIAVCMSLVSKVVTWATTADASGLRKCRPNREKIIVREKIICKMIEIPVGEADNWHPETEGMVRLILALQPHPKVLRWLLIMLTFGCRVEAACQTTSQQLRWSQYDLLVPGTLQIENKWRPELPVAPSALREFRTWEDVRWVGLSASRVGKVFRKIRGELGMPQLKPSSIRDYITTMLRHAHVDFEVRYIHDAEQETWQGHHRDDIHGRYGKYRPDYMIRSVVATEAMLRDLDFKSGGGLFRQGSDTADLNVLALQEDVEIAHELRVTNRAVLPRDTRVFIGPQRAETGDIGAIQGVFRQVSDNKVRHPDGTIDALGSFRRPPIERRFAEQGITLLEPVAASEDPQAAEIYLVADGSNFIPSCRSGPLGKDHHSAPAQAVFEDQIASKGEPLSFYKTRLREFELEFTELYDKCNTVCDIDSVDIRFDRELPFIVGPIIFEMDDPTPDLDFDGWTDEQILRYAKQQADERDAGIRCGDLVLIDLNSAQDAA